MQDFSSGGGLSCKIFGREAPENGAEGAVLENFSNFFEKLFLTNDIKSENLDTLGLEKYFAILKKMMLKTSIKCENIGYKVFSPASKALEIYFDLSRTRYFGIF